MDIIDSVVASVAYDRVRSYRKGHVLLRFEPPELAEKLAEAINIWKRSIEIEDQEYDFSEDIIDVTDPAFDSSDYDELAITADTTFTLGLPKWEDSVKITYGEFVALATELQSAELRENRECWTDRRCLIRVDPSSDNAQTYLSHAMPEADSEEERQTQLDYIEQKRKSDALQGQIVPLFEAYLSAGDEGFDEEASAAWAESRERESHLRSRLEKSTKRYCTHRTRLDGQEVVCSLTEGFTMFGIAVAAAGEYDSDLQPVLPGELFVELRYERRLSEDNAHNIFQAYLFELSSSLGLDFEVLARPSLEDWWWFPEDHSETSEARLRPLLLGKGLSELLGLYNRAVTTSDREVQILYFTKVLEYVSRTVVNQRSTEAIRAKLLSSRSLRPDADFIAELQVVIEEQRSFRKDREAIRLTVAICCEASELAKIAPPFLKKLRTTRAADKPKDKEEALMELGSSLYATRNDVAHAKANYEPTGEECPEEQMDEFAECAKLAAQQAVRWYHSRPEHFRIA